MARGDYVSTHKLSEAIALGSRGGCLPVIVVPTDRVSKKGKPIPGWGALSLLPYARWFPYCAVGFVVPEPIAC